MPAEPGSELPAPGVTTKRDLARAFNRWADDQGALGWASGR
jgi:hypothetical protein